jgi:hypothetical protein
MDLDHERLDVYELSLEFLVLANGIIGTPTPHQPAQRRFDPLPLLLIQLQAHHRGPLMEHTRAPMESPLF